MLFNRSEIEVYGGSLKDVKRLGLALFPLKVRSASLSDANASQTPDSAGRIIIIGKEEPGHTDLFDRLSVLKGKPLVCCCDDTDWNPPDDLLSVHAGFLWPHPGRLRLKEIRRFWKEHLHNLAQQV